MLELLWPTVCAGCEAPHQGRVCPTCATATLTSLPALPGARGGWYLAPYHAPIGRALGVAKYRPERPLMRRLGLLLAEHAAPAIAEIAPTAIVPAPSRWSTRARRGFASASVLAAEVGRVAGVPVVDALTVARGTRQAALSGAARRGNLAGRIRSRRPAPGRILLVDDVSTTGATVDACARELLGDVTEGVWVLVLCLGGSDAVTTSVRNS